MDNRNYIIDTDIIIDYFKGQYALNKKIKSAGLSRCFVSEITIAELKYGAMKSQDITKQNNRIKKLRSRFGVIPISDTLDLYAAERLRLERIGNRIEDFDLLIAVTSVAKEMILVTGNEKHHSRVRGIKIENWRRKEHNEFIEMR